MIRYYKGKQKVIRLTKRSKLGTALYEILEDGPLGKKGEKTVFPCRKGFIEPKLVFRFVLQDGKVRTHMKDELKEYIINDLFKDEEQNSLCKAEKELLLQEDRK
jgi:hypothetical protein